MTTENVQPGVFLPAPLQNQPLLDNSHHSTSSTVTGNNKQMNSVPSHTIPPPLHNEYMGTDPQPLPLNSSSYSIPIIHNVNQIPGNDTYTDAIISNDGIIP